MATLDELKAESTRIQKIIEASGGELTPQIESQLEITKAMVLAKVDAYIMAIKSLESDSERYKAFADEFISRYKGMQKNADYLKSKIKAVADDLGASVIEGERWKATFSVSQPRLVIDDHSKIHPVYFKQIPELDRVKLKQDLVEGGVVEGARLEQGLTMRIGVK